MSDKPLPFVITDRRKFNAEGEPRPDADPSPAKHRDPVPELPAAETRPAAFAGKPAPTPISGPVAVPAAQAPASQSPASQSPASHSPTAQLEEAAPDTGLDPAADGQELPPAPTAEQMEQSRLAFETTADRLDTAIRAANPGMDHPPAMSFEQIVQSVYMQAILQLGGGTQEGQQPQVDLLGARQSIDMLGILSGKTQGNLSLAEQGLLDSAIFELRLAFLEITQALARSAQQRGPGQAPGAGPMAPGGPGFGGPGRPSIVR